MALDIPWVRLGFPVLFEPRPVIQNGVETGAPRFSANLHFPANPDPALVRAVQEAVLLAHATKWPDPAKRPPLACQVGGDPAQWVNGLGRLRIPFVWGPATWPNDPSAAGWVLTTTARADSPPFVGELVNGIPVALAERAKAYPGAEVRASVGIFGYDKGAQSKGISAGLNGLVLTGREWPRFDSKPTVGQMFNALPASAPPPIEGGAPPMPGQGYTAPAMPAGDDGGGFF
jgi:hypothetical protein